MGRENIIDKDKEYFDELALGDELKEADKQFDMHVDPNLFGMSNGVPNQVPFGMPLTYSPKIGVNVVPNPLNLQIKISANMK